MNRRNFLKTLGLSAAYTLTISPFVPAAESKKTNLNILFFTADAIY
jgi:hypothetical protein